MGRQLFVEVAESAFRRWLALDSSLRAAALAYFIILPLPLLLLIILGLFSLIYGQTEAFEALIQQVTTVAGSTVAELIRQLLDAIKTPFTSVFASIVSLVFTFLGAIGAFGVLQDTMNEIWEVNPPKLTRTQQIKRKTGPFLLVLVLGLAIMVWTAFSTVLLSFITVTLGPLTANSTEIILRITQIGLSFVLATLLFAVIYKQIPDCAIKWKDVRLASIITGTLFTVTNVLIGVVIEVFAITSATGAAGAILILLPWLFLINQLILYGATFSRVYAEKTGSYAPKTSKVTVH